MAEHDVAELNRRYAIANRRTLYIFTGLVLLSIPIGILIAVQHYTALVGPMNVRSPAYLFWLVIACCAGFAGISSLGIRPMLPGALTVGVTSDGVRLRYPNRSETVLDWRRGRWSLTLHDFSASRRMVADNLVYFLTVGWDGRRTELSVDAYQDILRFAKEAGVRVRTGWGSKSLYGFRVLIHRVSPHN
jgi:hypothetical protein